ncbi:MULTISPECIES: GNAT family N-acetyltransferase [Actinomyces]|uniref:GNAT family N-acetyltransferase n=1 Tax=Actinomyces respiraculi TaxID=2744574 RepID=A0A7T0LJR8_9ACTO|nr:MULTISPECIES: GNAT family N-acetyltransferase [Actinomyces]QPL04443.1 GNAT family N-acetyltransferase [Actinomyces respiraculi]
MSSNVASSPSAETVYLRPLRDDDAEAVRRAFTGSTGMSLEGSVVDLESAQTYVRTRSDASSPLHGWAIVGGDDVLMGLVSVAADEDNGTGALSFWMGDDYRGRGLTRRAVATVADWALSDDGLVLDRLELEHVSSYRHAGNIARAAGFLQEGVLREARLVEVHDGEDVVLVREDVVIYGRLKDDPTPIVARLEMRPA